MDIAGNAEQVALEVLMNANRELAKNVTAAGRIIARRAKQLVPPPGYPGDDPALMPLRETLRSEYKEYSGDVKMAVVGPKRPEGAHGHLVERGFRHYAHGVPTGTIVAGQPFLEAAAKDTEQLVTLKITNAITDADRKSG